MDPQTQREKVLHFIKHNTLAVVSTVSQKDCKPESALVGFSETDNLEIIFGSFKTARKNKNLSRNQNVALVIGWSLDDFITIQYEGIAREVTGQEFKECREIHVQKNPSSRQYADHPDQRYFKVTPTWIRYSDLGKDPEEVFELEF